MPHYMRQQGPSRCRHSKTRKRHVTQAACHEQSPWSHHTCKIMLHAPDSYVWRHLMAGQSQQGAVEGGWSHGAWWYKKIEKSQCETKYGPARQLHAGKTRTRHWSSHGNHKNTNQLTNLQVPRWSFSVAQLQVWKGPERNQSQCHKWLQTRGREQKQTWTSSESQYIPKMGHRWRTGLNLPEKGGFQFMPGERGGWNSQQGEDLNNRSTLSLSARKGVARTMNPRARRVVQ